MKKTKGSVLILVLIITTVLTSIGITFASIIEKEVERQFFADNVLQAYLISDSAFECVLYNDFRLLAFDFTKNSSIRILCGEPKYHVISLNESDWSNLASKRYINSLRAGEEILRNPTTKLRYSFVVTKGEGNDIPCADVVITKKCAIDGINSNACAENTNGGFILQTEMTVVGYANCRPDSRSFINRRLKVSY